MKIVTFLYLILLSISDLKTKTVSKRILFPGVMVLCGMGTVRMFTCGESVWEWIACLTPGLVFVILSFLGASVGRADGYFLIGLGLGFGSEICLKTMGLGLLFSALFGIFALCKGWNGRRYKIPFFPFLTAGYLICLLN